MFSITILDSDIFQTCPNIKYFPLYFKKCWFHAINFCQMPLLVPLYAHDGYQPKTYSSSLIFATACSSYSNPPSPFCLRIEMNKWKVIISRVVVALLTFQKVALYVLQLNCTSLKSSIKVSNGCYGKYCYNVPLLAAVLLAIKVYYELSPNAFSWQHIQANAHYIFILL